MRALQTQVVAQSRELLSPLKGGESSDDDEGAFRETLRALPSAMRASLSGGGPTLEEVKEELAAARLALAKAATAAAKADKLNAANLLESNRLRAQLIRQNAEREEQLKLVTASAAATSARTLELAAARAEAAKLTEELADFKERAESQGRPPVISPSSSDDDVLAAADCVAEGAEVVGGTPGGARGLLAGLSVPHEDVYRLIITRLKRLLDNERRSIRLARAALAAELTSRADATARVEALLESTRAEMADKRKALGSRSWQESGRAGVMAALLHMETVLNGVQAALARSAVAAPAEPVG